ncbi:hypothetical protein PIB30_022666 [Stylosanthes scabra]|uniref:Uncharacterized protein n=1 Tax=Stylosanthes scabra TaxID=79078 RepID=A0ABU6V7E0_9FABA|nr:hypothetical protein [Stylosanthes scabra]
MKKGTFVAAFAPPPRGRRLHFCRRVVHRHPFRPSPPPQLPPPAAVLSPMRSPPSLPPSPLFNRLRKRVMMRVPPQFDPDIVWRQTLFEPYKNRVYGAGGFFTSSLRRSGYAGSSALASSCHTGPPAPEVVDLREQVQNLTQSLQSHGDLLQQQIDEVKSLKSTLAEKDARAEEHLRRMEEMSRMMAAFYGPLRPGTSGGSAAGIDSTTAPPLPPRPPPPPPPSHPPEGDDDDDYDDA